MSRIILSVMFVFLASACRKEHAESELYFPPSGTTTWESVTPDELGWKTSKIDELNTFLQGSETRAFIVLKNGKIVMEEYFSTQLDGQPFIASSYWYWASAGKTLTSMLTGIAQEQGYLDINDKSSDYMGLGWTSLTPAQEARITLRHQLTMTTGLDDEVTDNHCFDASCLVYKADAGTRWAYHNGPYTLLDDVISNSTGVSFSTYFNEQLRDKAGMDGFWSWVDNDHVYFSSARSAARFGLLVLNGGKWNETSVLSDNEYFAEMTSTSQSLNLSYGYLWWLNGKGSYMIPESQLVLNLDLAPSAPEDMIAAMGKNGQLINVIPSEGLVIVRMGDDPDGYLVPSAYQEALWQKIAAVIPF